MWTFVWIDGIEPTNNDAERVLRHAVLWRKSSRGTDSEVGSRFVERMLSVVATCRQQNQRLGATDRVLSCPPRRLCSSLFVAFVAGRSRTGRRLTGDFHARSGPSEAEKTAEHHLPRLDLGRIWEFLGGGKIIAIVAVLARLILVPFELVAWHGPELERQLVSNCRSRACQRASIAHLFWQRRRWVCTQVS